MLFFANTNWSKLLEILQETPWWYWVAMLGGLLLLVVLVGVFLSIREWLREDDDLASIDHQMLSEISELQRRGELTSEEFRSIKGQLVSRLSLTEKSSSTGSDRKKQP